MKSRSTVNIKHHAYHIVPGTLIPLKLATGMFLFALGLVIFFHTGFKLLFIVGILSLGWYLYKWSEAVSQESLDKEVHTKAVQEQLMFGAILFIVSETMLFFGFFWAFFHSSLNPSIFIGGIFPPKGIEPLNPFHWPLINTLTLLLSGVFVNTFYYSLKSFKDRTLYEIKNPSTHLLPLPKSNYITYVKKELKKIHQYLLLTITLGVIFLFFQIHEYINHATFELSDSVYGSVFYMLTGLHGFHVLAGVVFLTYSYLKISKELFTQTNPHVGVTFSVMYFHYVDIVWIFLYIFVYLWGS